MEGQNENDELYPIAVLIDELKVCSQIALWRGHSNSSYSTMMSSYD